MDRANSVNDMKPKQTHKHRQPNDVASQSNKMEMCHFLNELIFSFVNCRFKCESRVKSEFTQNTLSLSFFYNSFDLTPEELSAPKN